MKLNPVTRLAVRMQLHQLLGRWRLSLYSAVDFLMTIGPTLRQRRKLISRLEQDLPPHGDNTDLLSVTEADRRADILRECIRSVAGLGEKPSQDDTLDDLWTEAAFVHRHASRLLPYFRSLSARRVLYAGHCYYNNWYLSRGLREVGWRADVLNIDSSPDTQIYYHGEDFSIDGDSADKAGPLRLYLDALYRYDVIHFSNAHNISFGGKLKHLFQKKLGRNSEIYLLRKLGKKVCYTNNGCLDGVRQSSFAKWGPESVCASCRWQDVPEVCSDTRNRVWGKFRNSVTDYQCLLGGNRADYNRAPIVHEAPEAYCLDKDIWNPELEIPERFLLPSASTAEPTIRLYHAVGDMKNRTRGDGTNIKSTHIFLPLIDKLREEGHRLELISPTGVPNMEIRYLQNQADIFLEMLTFGWFGANAREAMMLGKPVICYIRPEWLESLRLEIPEYADELPIVCATPETVEDVLRDLITDRDKRLEIGRRSREFAIKWHSKESAARRFDETYSRLLLGDPILVEYYA